MCTFRPAFIRNLREPWVHIRNKETPPVLSPEHIMTDTLVTYSWPQTHKHVARETERQRESERERKREREKCKGEINTHTQKERERNSLSNAEKKQS